MHCELAPSPEDGSRGTRNKVGAQEKPLKKAKLGDEKCALHFPSNTSRMYCHTEKTTTIELTTMSMYTKYSSTFSTKE